MSKNTPVFFSDLFEKEETIETLIEESRADADFYLFLTFAAFITTLGLLINNPIVIIGAMLVAPILFPILSLGMGVVTSSREAIMRSVRILGKSIFAVVAIAFVTSIVLNKPEVTEQLMLTSTPNFIFFLVALFSGIVAAFSWVKKNTTTLPGVAITVSLVPPLAALGIGLSFFDRAVMSGSLLLFIMNLIGITFASVMVFSLFGFSNLRKWQDHKIEEEEKEHPKGEPLTQKVSHLVDTVKEEIRPEPPRDVLKEQLSYDEEPSQ